MSLKDYSEACYSYLMKNTTNLPMSYIRIDVAHLVHMVCNWKCLKGRRQIKDFYMRSVGLLIRSESFEHFDCIIRNILILAMAETDGHDNINEKTPSETSRIFLENLISGTNITDRSAGKYYKGIQEEDVFYFDPEDNLVNVKKGSPIDTWLNMMLNKNLQLLEID